MKVAFLTNEVPPYRVPLYAELAKSPGWEFRVFTCVDREIGRQWTVETSLPFSTQRSYSLSYVRRRNYAGQEGFGDERQIHLPVGLLWNLLRYAPDVIISGEMGARTAIGALYARLCGSRLLVYFVGVFRRDAPHGMRH
jgi:hypothetical protein